MVKSFKGLLGQGPAGTSLGLRSDDISALRTVDGSSSSRTMHDAASDAADALLRYGIRWDPDSAKGTVVTIGFLSSDAAASAGGRARALTDDERAVIGDLLASIEAVANIDFRIVDGDIAAIGEADIAIIGEEGTADGWSETYTAGDAITAAFLSVGLDEPLTLGSGSAFAALQGLGFALGLARPTEQDPSTIRSYRFDAAYTEDTQQYSMMSYWSEIYTDGYYRDDRVAAPMLHDVTALHRLYGANEQTRSGDDVYGWNGTTGDFWSFGDEGGAPIGAIWDAGGTDTIDANTPGYGYTQRIDLREGAFSSTGGLQANIAIAFGVTVENASGGAGEDWIHGNSADNRLDGRGGQDTVSFAHAAGGVVVDLASGTASGSGTDTLVGFEAAEGSDHADRLSGTVGANTLSGGAGDDTLSGRGGDDLIIGGAGVDLARYAEAGSGVHAVLWDAVATVADGAGGTDTLEGVEHLEGSAYADLIEGAETSDGLLGGSGDDTLIGNRGADRIDGGVGADVIYGDAAPSHPVVAPLVFGTDGDDRLSGNRYDNEVRGLGGDDTLSGGEGADSLYGGEGDDVVLFAPTDAYADGGAGQDVLDLSAFFADDGPYTPPTAEGIEVKVGTGTSHDVGYGDMVSVHAPDWHPDWYQTWQLDGFESVIGTHRADRIYVQDGTGIARGAAGDDELIARGAQTLYGEDGNDRLEARGVGAVLYGGDDRMGVERGDRFVITMWSDDTTIADFGVGLGHDRISLTSYAIRDTAEGPVYAGWNDLTITDTEEGALVSVAGGRLDGSSDVLVLGVSAAELTIDDFVFYG